MSYRYILVKSGHKKLFKIEIPTITLAIVIILNLYYLYLLDPSVDKIAGIVAQDFALLVAIAWGAYYWIKMIKLKNPVYQYKNWMLSFVIMALLSALQSMKLYGQSFINGFAPQRWVLIWALLYFPISKLLFNGKISREGLLTVLKMIAVLQVILFIAQYFVGSTVMFLHVNTGFRKGSIRYYYSPILLDLFFFLCLDDFIKKGIVKKCISVIFVILVIFDTMFVQQFRLTTMGLVICLGLYILFMREDKLNKIFYFIIGSVALVILFNTPMVQEVINTVLNNSYDNGTKIRWIGRELYMGMIMKHPLLGGGYPSTYCDAARQAAGMNNFIYLYDNGVFGFMYIYGFIGVVWVVSLWRKIISDGLYIRNRTKELAYFLFPVFFVITCINELHWYWEYGFVVFSIFLCLMNSKINERSFKI